MYVVNTIQLQNSLNIFETKIQDVKNQMLEAKTCHERLLLGRRIKELKKMQNLLFCPERAQAFISKHSV